MPTIWKPDLPMLAAPENSGRNQRAVRDGFWRKLRATFARIPFAEQAVAAYFAAMDPVTPKRAKLLLFAALAYFIAPTDAVPDFIAALGFTDDAAVFLAAWRLVQDQIRPDHVQKAQETLERMTDKDLG